jgi:hypothetical protein
MAESDRLLVACPQCHAWPMAASGQPKWHHPREMIFRCPRCGHQATARGTPAALRSQAASAGFSGPAGGIPNGLEASTGRGGRGD